MVFPQPPVVAMCLNRLTSADLTLDFDPKCNGSDVYTIYVTWDGELRDGASELALGEGGPVVVLIQDHYLYCGRILQSLAAGRQRKGFQLHT